jgi:cytochrome c
LRAKSRIGLALLGVSVLFGQCEDAFASGPTVRMLEGRAILARHCAKCHAIDKTSQSVLRQAPPLREIYRRYPLERLEFELSEGIGSTHPEMPQIQFSTEQIEMILEYLADLNGTD